LSHLLKLLALIRYRGYYWDVETGYYYCQSRYYNPEWCRWISADAFWDTGDGVLGTNMYAYCHNDPVNLADPSGMASDMAAQLGQAMAIAMLVSAAATLMHENLGMSEKQITAFWLGIDANNILRTAETVINKVQAGYSLLYSPNGGFFNYMSFVPPSQVQDYISSVEMEARAGAISAAGGVAALAFMLFPPAGGLGIAMSIGNFLTNFTLKPTSFHGAFGIALDAVESLLDQIASNASAELRRFAANGSGFVITNDDYYRTWSSRGDYGFGVYPWIWVK